MCCCSDRQTAGRAAVQAVPAQTLSWPVISPLQSTPAGQHVGQRGNVAQGAGQLRPARLHGGVRRVRVLPRGEAVVWAGWAVCVNTTAQDLLPSPAPPALYRNRRITLYCVLVPRHSATNTPHMDTPHMDTPHTGHIPYSTQAILKQVHTGQTSYCPDPILRHYTYLDTKHTKPKSILVLLPYLTLKI